MSTFKIEDSKIVDMLFPESHWKAVDAPTYNQIFDCLLSEDPLKSEMMRYIQKRKPRIGYHRQYKSGGGWTLLGNITLAEDAKPLKPYELSLIIHETCHLHQSLLMRLSMQGELRAWQCQARTYPQIAYTKGARIGSNGEAYWRGGSNGETCELWDELLALSSESRTDLEKAQDIMARIAQGYRSHALPLYPLHKEIWFYLKQGRFKQAWDVIYNLVTAAG